jgi:hypothetical protein
MLSPFGLPTARRASGGARAGRGGGGDVVRDMLCCCDLCDDETISKITSKGLNYDDEK